MHPKDADGMANRADPDQTAPQSVIFLFFTFFYLGFTANQDYFTHFEQSQS